MILHSHLSRNDDHHPQTSIVNSRRRRAKCGLIPAVWDLDAILLRLPPILSLMPPVRSASDKTGVRQSFGRGIWATGRIYLFGEGDFFLIQS